MLIYRHADICEVSAPAKLNLFLEILGKRPDGYHELETLMLTVSLYDTLRFQSAETNQISLRNHWCGSSGTGQSCIDLPTDSQNLVIKAAILLSQSTGSTQGAQIDLLKRIPLAAGLAGGSSDAAATLIGLNQLWDTKLSLSDLQELGANLGSDVPFFLAATGAAVCRGRGEIIEPVKFASKLHFVIVKPAVGLSTAQVFQHCKPAPVPKTVTTLVQSLQCGDLRGIGASLMNRLGEPAEQLCPDVAGLSKEMASLPVAGHLMSGSGTSYFGLCRHRQQALHLAGRLRSLGIGSVFNVQSCV
jgi:4-diphosphocytidyl-2-C-methyl-D-erythritol kinase